MVLVFCGARRITQTAQYTMSTAEKITSAEPVSEVEDAVEDAVEDSDETAEGVNARAAELLDAMPPEHREGLRDLLELARCIGMPGARALLMSAAPYGATQPAAEVAARVTAATPFDCEGSISIEFIDAREGRGGRTVANIYAAPAPRAHDFGREIAALRAAVPPARWGEVAKHFSNLVLYVRTQLMAAASSEPHASALAKCGGALAEVVRASVAGRLVAQVDPDNLTVYIHPDWARVGIFVGGATPGSAFE